MSSKTKQTKTSNNNLHETLLSANSVNSDVNGRSILGERKDRQRLLVKFCPLVEIMVYNMV